jgi:ABC-type multidrug transport system fused ATPase/permease subunit
MRPHHKVYLTCSRSGKNLYLALFSAYGAPYAFAAFLKIIQDCLAFLQPQLLRWLLNYVSTYQAARFGQEFGGSPPPNPLQGFAIAVLMFVAAVVQTVVLHQVSDECYLYREINAYRKLQYFQLCYETGMRVRAGLVTAVYKKALVMSSADQGRSTGDIINLMSVDSTRLQDFCTYGLIALSGPFQVCQYMMGV